MTKTALLGMCMGAVGWGAQLTISATSPHLANNSDPSTVVVTARDDLNRPITNAEIELDIRPPAFVSQISHYAMRVETFHSGNGQYRATFTSPIAGPLLVIATDRVSNAEAETVVLFTGTPLIQPPDFSSGIQAAAVLGKAAGKTGGPIRFAGTEAEIALAKKFFEKLDNEFLPSVLADRINKEADPAKKAALQQRLEDMIRVGAILETEIARETFIARGGTPTAADTATFATRKQDAKAAFQRISDAQEAVLKEFFGNPIDFAKVQKSMELFNNFDLVADFAEAIKRLELVAQLATETDPVKIAVLQLRIQALGRLIVNGPDGSVAHIRWAKFANIAIELGISDNLWRNMKAITAKGSSITVKVLSDNDDTKAGIQPAKQNDATIDGERAIYDPLRPKDTDTDAMKNQKIEEIEKKLIDLLKKIRVDRKTLAQLPGLDGDRTLVAAVAASQCFGGNAAVLATQINSAITLSRVGDDLFGFGSDNAG